MQRKTYVKADEVLKIGQRIEVMVFNDTRSFSSRIEDIQEKMMVLAMPTDPRGVPLVVSVGTDVRCNTRVSKKPTDV